MQLITVPLEIGFGQSSVNVQDLEHQQPLQLPPQPLQQQQFQLLAATRDGLMMDIVMISIIIWTVTMMVVTVVDLMLIHNIAL